MVLSSCFRACSRESYLGLCGPTCSGGYPQIAHPFLLMRIGGFSAASSRQSKKKKGGKGKNKQKKLKKPGAPVEILFDAFRVFSISAFGGFKAPSSRPCLDDLPESKNRRHVKYSRREQPPFWAPADAGGREVGGRRAWLTTRDVEVDSFRMPLDFPHS